MWIMVALIGVLVLAVTALGYRLWKLRQVGGTAAILRDYPAEGGHGWRHGVLRYSGGEADFYRLSSMRWWADRRSTASAWRWCRGAHRAVTSSTS
jgi:hypothetical protein